MADREYDPKEVRIVWTDPTTGDKAERGPWGPSVLERVYDGLAPQEPTAFDQASAQNRTIERMLEGMTDAQRAELRDETPSWGPGLVFDSVEDAIASLPPHDPDANKGEIVVAAMTADDLRASMDRRTLRGLERGSPEWYARVRALVRDAMWGRAGLVARDSLQCCDAYSTRADALDHRPRRSRQVRSTRPRALRRVLERVAA